MAQPVVTFSFEGDPPSWDRILLEMRDISGVHLSMEGEGERWVVIKFGASRVALGREHARLMVDVGALWPPRQAYLEEVALFALYELRGLCAGAAPRRPRRWVQTIAGRIERIL